MSAFSTAAPEFEKFLASVKADPALAPGSGGSPENTRFIPRNFLIEERLDPLRIATYAVELPLGGRGTFVEWITAHNGYLEKHVFLKPPALHDYHSVARNNPAVCPETF